MIKRNLQNQLTIFGLLLLLTGCSSMPARFTYTESQVEQVWPAQPEQARYRYVGQLTGEENFVSEERKAFSFGKKVLYWLVGLIAGEAQPVILQRPQAGVVDGQGRIYITDVSRQAVYVFDVVSNRLSVWEMATDNLRFVAPTAISVGPSNEVLVSDAELGSIIRLDSQGEPVGEIGKGILQRPTGIVFDPATKTLFVADTHAHNIKRFDASGVLLSQFGKKGEKTGEFNSPTYLALGQGELFVTDTLNARIQVFTLEGEFKREFGRRGLYVGNLTRPKGVTVDNKGLAYVVESFYDHLLIFNGQGEFMMPIGGSGQAVGQFYLPAGVWTDNNNRIYVADSFNGRVMIFEYLAGKAPDV